ncbi:TonB-dependent receptor plug domain-containing protein [Altericroceibacterium xinjiangense]|uniref:TonB-dependent receptor plug domain-containing protein n=1 Tax=Altericroceibacterium xinjiangense TaxID=762261 RepID=UPI0019D23FE1|nr:TonB-dependent receptor [Altericroceibacterium xinjiangense]
MAQERGTALPSPGQITPDVDREVGADVLDNNSGEVLNPTLPPAPEQQGISQIVVTGSRIARPDYQATSPIVSVDQALFEQSSTAALEQNLNKLPQFVPAQTPTAGADIQPTATNTPGAATISLRGIGANRNLVLLEGRRSTPSNASGVTDINTIPAAAIERVEVITGGASATYGADAVAGVTNFILKKNFEGLELDGQMGVTARGDGFEYQISGIMGTDFDDGRGNVSLALSMNDRGANMQRNRPWFRDLWQDPLTDSGAQFFINNPGINFGFANLPDFSTVFPGANPEIPPGTVVFTNTDGSAFTQSFQARGGVPNFNGPLGTEYKVTAAGDLVQNNTDLFLILPLTRYNAFARGNYEINDWIGVFGQALFSHVETFTRNEPGPVFAGWGAIIDPQGLDQDQLPDDLWTLLNSRENPDAPFTLQTLLPENRETSTDVMTYNITTGLQGSVPSLDWTWEAFVNHGVSSTYAVQTGIYSLQRLRAVLTAPNFGRGFSAQGNAAFGGFGASSATCTSGLNFFIPPEGGFSEDCLEAVRADLQNRSEFRQTIAEANVQGGLFELPGGELRFAAGASYRENDFEFQNDTLTTQGRSFNDQALGIYPSGNSDGYYDVKEVYGELLIPIVRDLPFARDLSLEIGGRISDYSTTGTQYTYKILGDWALNDWLRVRGGYNRAQRAPNIGELFLAPQQTFGINTAGDPCSLANPLSFSANRINATGAQVEAVCRILMEQSGNPDADREFYAGSASQDPSTFGFAFPTLVGNQNLVPETADTWTAGVVVSSPFTAGLLSRFQLSVDWYSINVKDAIGAQTVATALQQCFDVGLNPLIATDPVAAANSEFCQNVPRVQTGGLGNVLTTYVNNNRFEVSGIDAQLDWAADVGPGTLNVNALVNYQLHFRSAGLPVLPLVDYTGTFGTTEGGLSQGVYEYRVFTTVGYGIGRSRIALQWQHLPSVEDSSEAQFGSTPTTGAPAYNLFHLNGSYGVTEDVTVRFGVENLFDKAPPRTNINPTANLALGQLPGGEFNNTFYDVNGRRFYLGANVKF